MSSLDICSELVWSPKAFKSSWSEWRYSVCIDFVHEWYWIPSIGISSQLLWLLCRQFGNPLYLFICVFCWPTQTHVLIKIEFLYFSKNLCLYRLLGQSSPCSGMSLDKLSSRGGVVSCILGGATGVNALLDGCIIVKCRYLLRSL